MNLPVLLDYAGIDSCNGIPIGIYDNLEEQTHSLQATRNSTEYAWWSHNHKSAYGTYELLSWQSVVHAGAILL